MSQPADHPTVDSPSVSDDPGLSRTYAREWYWEHYDYHEYTCPNCDRGIERVYDFHVHHKDGDPTNNDPENLIGLCNRCHMWEHTNSTVSGLDLIEWQEAFLELGRGDRE